MGSENGKWYGADSPALHTGNGVHFGRQLIWVSLNVITIVVVSRDEPSRSARITSRSLIEYLILGQGKIDSPWASVG